MVSLSKAYFYLYLLLVLSLFFAPALFTSLDELALLLMLMLGAVDVLYNRDWKKYKPLFVAGGVLFFYYVYSLGFCHYNIFKAITMDFWTHLKPVIAFSVAYAIAPEFTAKQRFIIKSVIVVMAVAGVIVFYSPYFHDMLFHVYYFGNIYIGGAIIWLMLMANDSERNHKNDIVCVLMLILLGLQCTRSKYYGIAVVFLFMLLMYKPKIIAHISFKNMLLILLLICGVIFVAWEKISFYFVTGGAGVLEDAMATADDVESLGMMMARPAMYYFSILVFADHLWLGSGLASFASYCSSPDYNYSALYHEYGIDKIWGLSEEYPAFIADTFYPELAQFGLVGVLTLVACVLWFCKRLKLVHRLYGTIPFVTGLLVLVSLGIDAVASTGPVNSIGENLFAVLGMILAKVKYIDNKRADEALKSPLADGLTVWRKVGLKIKRY